MIHELKTWVECFEDVFSGKKSFEVRRNDRDFQIGDYLILKEWNIIGYNSVAPNEFVGEYTGRECYRKVIYILHGDAFGVMAGYVVMGIRVCDMAEIKEIEIELKKGLKSIQ